MKSKENFQRTLDKEFYRLFVKLLQMAFKSPKRIIPFFKMMIYQKKQKNKRRKYIKEGKQIPSFLIISVTAQCNLRCKGCYAHALQGFNPQEMNAEKLYSVLKEADEMGIAAVLLVGGEPLMRKDLLMVLHQFPKMLFALFTNGLLIDKALAHALGNVPNIIPIISIEGNCRETDDRRGSGVHEKVMKSMVLLHQYRILFGASITVNRSNFSQVTDAFFIKTLRKMGTRLFFYVEYVPVVPGTEMMVIQAAQRILLENYCDTFKQQYGALYFAFPAGEKKFGGCLAAGRGFVHINASGNVEPCPFAAFTDSNQQVNSLLEAINSPLLQWIRDNHELLESGDGGCSLWANKHKIKDYLMA